MSDTPGALFVRERERMRKVKVTRRLRSPLDDIQGRNQEFVLAISPSDVEGLRMYQGPGLKCIYRYDIKYKKSSGDEIANVNFYAVRPGI